MRTRDAQFKAFYFAEGARLRHLALLLCGNPTEAEDLAQEALARAYRAWHRIGGEQPGPYVRRVLVNLHRNSLRRKLTERKYPQPAPEPVPSSDRHIDDALHVAAALAELSPVRRATVLLRYFEDLPEAEIARLLNRPLGTVKSDLHRALKQLRPRFEQHAREAR